MQEFRLPSLGADMDEGTLVAWKIKPGDMVRRGDVVAIVDTSKAAIDVESWQEGTVQELRVQPGDKIPTGTVMAILDGEDAAASSPDESATQAAAAPAPSDTERQESATRVAATGTSSPADAVKTYVEADAPRARLRISPAARKRAGELGIDVATLHGSGPEGSITLADVAAIATAEVVASADATRTRTADMRRTIAAAMSRSKREIPHYYLAETVMLDKVLAWLHGWNAARPITERVLLSAVLLKAVARALRRFPELNGFFVDGEFRTEAVVHAGVAIALRTGGLIAPALRDVDTRPLGELMQALNDLVRRARAGSLRSSELSSATITVTNLGEQSVEEVFGVIYPPQVALVGFGGIRQQVVAIGDCMKVVPVLRASLAADHRVSDGLAGAKFLQYLAALLQDPAGLATEDST